MGMLAETIDVTSPMPNEYKDKLKEDNEINYFSNIKTKKNESDYSGSNPTVIEAQALIDSSDGTVSHGKKIWCTTCNNSAIKVIKKLIQSAGGTLTTDDVNEIKKIAHAGCDKIQYEGGTAGWLGLVRKASKRRGTCHSYVNKKFTKLMGDVGGGYGVDDGGSSVLDPTVAATAAQDVFAGIGDNTKTTDTTSSRTMPMIIGGVLLLVVVAIIIFIIKRRKKAALSA